MNQEYADWGFRGWRKWRALRDVARGRDQEESTKCNVCVLSQSQQSNSEQSNFSQIQSLYPTYTRARAHTHSVNVNI